VGEPPTKRAAILPKKKRIGEGEQPSAPRGPQSQNKGEQWGLILRRGPIRAILKARKPQEQGSRAKRKKEKRGKKVPGYGCETASTKKKRKRRQPAKKKGGGGHTKSMG